MDSQKNLSAKKEAFQTHGQDEMWVSFLVKSFLIAIGGLFRTFEGKCGVTIDVSYRKD